MPATPPRTRPPRLLGLLGLLLLLSACAETTDEVVEAEAHGGDDAFPLTVENCGREFTLEEPPERILLLHSAPVTTLAELDLLDRVVAKAGAFPEEYVGAETRERLEEIPSLVGADAIDADGHYELSQEEVVAQEPDLVMGETDGVTQDGLADAGIPLLIVPSQCPAAADSPDFGDVYDLVETYGEIFDRREAAGVYAEQLRSDVERLRADAAQEERTAAALYPTPGGGAGWAYGNVSMVHPQLEAAGFENVFGDVDERVFEVSAEELLERDPDVLVLLHITGDPDPFEEAVRSLPGAEAMTAVREDAILVQLFNFSEPPTPLTVDGLERIIEAFGDRP